MNKFNIIEVKPQGYCGGVLKAIQIAKLCRMENPDDKITILGNLVHNQYVKKALATYNIDTVEDKTKTRLELLDLIQDGIVIFTAHGVSHMVKEKAKEKQLKIYDASCPFVLSTQKIIQERLLEGYVVFYIGKNHHPEAESVYSTSSNIYLIESEKDIPSHIEKPIFVTNQTTMSIYDIQFLFDAIRKMYPEARIHDEICNATRVRQQAILDLKDKNVDALIVVGDPTSNNTKQLACIGKQAGILNVFRVETVNDIVLDHFKDCHTIAVTSGASTPTYLTRQIIDYLNNPESKPEIDIHKIL